MEALFASCFWQVGQVFILLLFAKFSEIFSIFLVRVENMTAYSSDARNQDAAFLDDGYTEMRYLSAVPGLRPEVFISIRPATVTERRAFSDVSSSHQKDYDQQSLRSAKFIADHIVSWSLPRDPKDPEVLVKLRPAIWEPLFGMVWGDTVGDPLPGEDAAQPAGAETQQADSKNS